MVALPPTESAALLGEPAPALEDSPIVSVHLLFDRRLLGFPLAALLGSPAHWVFDRGAPDRAPSPASGQYLTVVSSGAPELLRGARPRARRAACAGELTERLGPGRAPLVAGEPRAGGDVRRAPGHRPPCAPAPATGRAGVVRAGAWTDTGLAGDDGERDPKRPRRGAPPALLIPARAPA